MDRETKELTIGTHKFTVKTYATAREAQAIQQIYFKGTKVEVAGDQPKISDFNPAVQFDVQNEMIVQMVLDMDGASENLVERCLDLPSDLFSELVTALDVLVGKKKS